MTGRLERTAGAQHALVAAASVWLIATSPWIGMRRILPEHPTFWDLAHVWIGLATAVLAVTYLAANIVGGRWRQHWPWLLGRIGPAGRDLAGIFRGRIPQSGGDGLFPVIQGLTLLLLAATAVTGVGWLISEGSRAALAWREWHALAANAFGWCLLVHAIAGIAHVAEFFRN